MARLQSWLPAAALATLVGVAGCGDPASTPPVTVTVKPGTETGLHPRAEGHADDPAIWYRAAAPQRLWVIGTDKASGLVVYDRHGRPVHFVAAKKVNNVDILSHWNGDAILVGASQRSVNETREQERDRLIFFTLDPANGKLSWVGAVDTDLADPYGFALVRYQGQVYAVVTGKLGGLRQYALGPNGNAGIRAELVRSVKIGGVSEGIAANPITGALYIAEERVGIWRYWLDPAAGDRREMVARVDGERLVADVEGLTLAKQKGWLIASSQGGNHFTVFRVPGGEYVGTFRIGDNPELGIDAVTHTDGIALAVGRTPGYPGGLFVAQDDVNGGGRAQNFKFVAWRSIRHALAKPQENGGKTNQQ